MGSTPARWRTWPSERRPIGAIKTFTLAFEDAELNEGDDARAIAAAIGIEARGDPPHGRRTSSTASTPPSTRLDQPTFDGLNSYFMAKAVREAGLTVALAGTGGDELFGGYETFRRLPLAARLDRRGARVPPRRAGPPLGRAGSRQQRGRGASVPPQTRWAKLPAMVRRPVATSSRCTS